MYRELNKKRIILERRRPYNDNVVRFLDELDLIDVAYTSAKLDGSALTREMITDMLKGKFYPDISLNEHAKIQRYREVLSELESMCQMKMGLSQSVLSHVYSRIENVAEVRYRDNNPVIFEWEYNPPHPKDVEMRLYMLMNWIGRDGDVYDNVNPLETPDLQESPSDFVLRAAYLHNRLIEIYPFNEGNAETARFIMYYYLMYKGYPVFELNFSEREYNEAIAEYLHNGDIRPFYNGLMQSLTSKMELIMSLTAIE